MSINAFDGSADSLPNRLAKACIVPVIKVVSDFRTLRISVS